MLPHENPTARLGWGWLELLKGEGGPVTHQKPVLVGINYFALQFFCSVLVVRVSQARGTIKVPPGKFIVRVI